MLAVDIKRGVEATLERVFQNTGRRFDKLSIIWGGKTAGIIANKSGDSIDAKVIFPAVDETKEITRDTFNQLIGYALHELGHAWFTDNHPWDNARIMHGAFVSSLINGLEDPRIEQRVIDSGYAPNSRVLFENLINRVLLKSGHVEGDDIGNIPFLLAVEGRRLNGYSICMPDPIDGSPYAEDLRWALDAARQATDTAGVVRVAIELHERLKQAFEQPEDQPDQPDEPKGDEGTDGIDGGDDDDQGDESGDDGSGNPSDEDGEDGNGKPDDKPSDKPSDKRNGKKFPRHAGRDVEPTEHINQELADAQCEADDFRQRPHVGKPKFAPINFS